VDKQALLTPRVNATTDTVDIEGVGTVTVRALSRWEMIHVFKLESNRHKQEQAALAFGLVDPAMTEDDVAAWQKAAPAMEIEAVARKINELSGIGKDAAKSHVSGDGDGPDAGV
jgi:hypothetical protein